MNAREAAMLTLNACERQGGWSDGTLKKQLAAAQLDGRDAALATQLCFGVLQNRLLLDFYLGHLSSISLKRMESRVLQILRLGAYQLLFLDKIPHSAAVNSAVEMARSYSKNPRVPGMVNAILRGLERNLHQLPTIPSENRVSYLSTLYSHPEWLVKEYLSILGPEETAALLRANNGHPPVTAMVNTTRTTQAELIDRLAQQRVEAQPHPWMRDCLILSGTGNLEALDAFREGLFYVQDLASRMAVLASGVKPGDRVLDVCAAPGGKSFAAAIQMENRGEIISCDLHAHKKKLIQNGADRLGLSVIRPMTADGKEFRPTWEGHFDAVIVDAPCSGLGVIRKKPDIRYKDPEPLKDLPEVQLAILSNAARYVRPGGVLLYSTCTVLPRENQAVVERFLDQCSDITLEHFAIPGISEPETIGMLSLWPHVHDTDGFFISKLRKME